ncbi:HlyD family type I secretion periplasmic adaptor subunit [Niveispirillum sp.]|uniref:HlyD family type I secretion periplasmic adaptor subunit n=1 Tax=Niveispirillum sp. TaxID=1917217 RepID=UPI001B7CD0EF|nr:HlyD family type I secretion periplasmic adaptor subunit [Niveispirillum sp.]MBP7334805.1 HlyD family type I secretion periplasmic adaptor subunit [Niveispirillum sp.]
MRPFRDLRARWRRFVGTPVPRMPVAPEALEFQTELEIIVREPPPPILGAPHLIAVGMLVLIAIIACFVQVDKIVVAPGRLVTQAPSILLQPIERAVVREVRVRPGDVVRKGQVLATLDPTFAQADRAALSSRQRSLFAQLQRLELEAAGKPVPDSMAADPDPDITLQTSLMRQRKAQYNSRLASLDGDIASLEASLRSTLDEQKALTEQLTVYRDVENVRAQLYKAQTGSRLQLLESQAARMEAERTLQTMGNRLGELRATIGARRAERQNFIDDWQRQLLELLVTTRHEASQVDEELAKAVRRNDLVELSAPADAVVQEVARMSAGAVAREAEALITLVALDTPLVADVTISSSDIGYVKAGDPVEVKVDPFPFQRHGMLKGTLRSVSRESFAPGTIEQSDALRSPIVSASYVHRAQVDLLSTQLDRMPAGTMLTAGMSIQAEIKVGSRSLMSYFLYPILRGLDEALHEP